MFDCERPFGFPFADFTTDARFVAKKEITVDGRKYKLVEGKPELKHGSFHLSRNLRDETVLSYGLWHILAITKEGRIRLVNHIRSGIGFDVDQDGKIIEEGQ